VPISVLAGVTVLAARLELYARRQGGKRWNLQRARKSKRPAAQNSLECQSEFCAPLRNSQETMDIYLHVSVLFSMIPGMDVSHLLRGMARMVQHPKQYKVYWVHLVWTIFLFLYLLHFWWWEFRLRRVDVWASPLYLLIASYALLL
jgi:hypothetical protein